MISQLSISQNSYPKEVKLGNDTVVCITFPQLKNIIYEIELSEGKTQIIDSMEVALNICDTSLSYYQAVVNNLESQNINLTNQIDKHKKINHLLVQVQKCITWLFQVLMVRIFYWLIELVIMTKRIVLLFKLLNGIYL